MFAVGSQGHLQAGRRIVSALVVGWLALAVSPGVVWAQKTNPPGTPAAKQEKPEAGPQASDNAKLDEAAQKAEAALNAPSDAPAQTETPAAAPKADSAPNMLELWFQGGILMIPITMMSFVVMVFGVERLIGLRRRKVIPPALVDALGDLSNRQGAFDPREAYKLCQQYPSTASSVIRSVLLKVGRPHSEVEHTMTEACEREAAKLYKNVRWINLATTLTPLLGLLGTVQGMIECFYRTSTLTAGQNKTEVLAGGIYVALVTTFGGLVVAIPAAVIAHYFEGRIQSLFRDIDELLMGLLPQLERYEGKLRFSRQSLSAVEAPPQEAPRPGAEFVPDRKIAPVRK
jgi:biopolymer transport protein ExbB